MGSPAARRRNRLARKRRIFQSPESILIRNMRDLILFRKNSQIFSRTNFSWSDDWGALLLSSMTCALSLSSMTIEILNSGSKVARNVSIEVEEY